MVGYIFPYYSSLLRRKGALIIGHPSSSTEWMSIWVVDKGGEMAKFYNAKRREVFWSDNDLFAPVEDAYFELGDFIAMKKLNGHDEKD